MYYQLVKYPWKILYGQFSKRVVLKRRHSTIIDFIKETHLGRLFDRVDLIKSVSNVRPWIGWLSVRPSIHKRSFDFNEVWSVDWGRRVMHDGMQYNPIQRQGQGQGHEPFKDGNPAIFKSYLLRHLQWELATDHGFLN